MAKEVNRLDLDMLTYKLISIIDYIYYDEFSRYIDSKIVIETISYAEKYYTLSISLRKRDDLKYYFHEYIYLEMLSKENIIEILLNVLDRLNLEFKREQYQCSKRSIDDVIDNIIVKFTDDNKELLEIKFINQSYSDTLSEIDEIFSSIDKEDEIKGDYKRVLKSSI